jgi:hypothetical protein
MTFPCKGGRRRGLSSRCRNSSKRLFLSASAFDPAGSTFPVQCLEIFHLSTTFRSVRSFINNDMEHSSTVPDNSSSKRRMRTKEETISALSTLGKSVVTSCSSTWRDKHHSDCDCLCYWAFADDLQDGICFNDCKGCTCGFPCRRLNWDKAWTDYKLSCKRNEIFLLQTSGNHGLLILSGVGVSTLVDPDSICLYV